MTSHRYCHFALHVNLKNTCILLMHCSLCLCNEKKELNKCFTTFKLFCNIRYLKKIQWGKDCCIFWPAFEHCPLKILFFEPSTSKNTFLAKFCINFFAFDSFFQFLYQNCERSIFWPACLQSLDCLSFYKWHDYCAFCDMFKELTWIVKQRVITSVIFNRLPIEG